VNTDTVLERDGLSSVVGHLGVEVMNRAEAVTAQLEAVRHHTESVLSDVESELRVSNEKKISSQARFDNERHPRAATRFQERSTSERLTDLPRMRPSRISIWYDHLGETRSIHNRAISTLVSIKVLNRREDDPFAVVEADVKLPVLPRDLVPRESETDSERLRNRERFEIRSEGPILSTGARGRQQKTSSVNTYAAHLFVYELSLEPKKVGTYRFSLSFWTKSGKKLCSSIGGAILPLPASTRESPSTT
jgi:hypothetical protein